MRFLQPAGDFPVQVTLGEKVPAWGLSRRNAGGIRFLPPDDEGFALRGDTRHGTGNSFMYRGRKRSHRFTILGGTAFEYDCILEKEPESNVITLLMEGAGQFDFFRQPGFLKNPLLAGSYAVYKKETLPGEGTGKLCHIHRPLIMDARGRRCWGDLSVTGDKLCIAIPEAWLSGAMYPVVVDPVIGLSGLGALGPEDEGGDENSYWGFNDGDGMELASNMGVNQFTAPHDITGNCTAHVYADYYPGGYYWSTAQEKVWPVLYTHDPAKGRPHTIKSSTGGYISNDVGRAAGPPRGWRSTNITVDGTIRQGDSFWFGFFFWHMEPRYDYGGRLYRCRAWPYQDTYAGVRQQFYRYPVNVETEYEEDEDGNEIEQEVWAEPSYELKISMYLDYSVPAAHYARTLTQGVTLADTRNLAGGFYRGIVQNAKNTMSLKGSPARLVRLIEAAAALYEMKAGAGFKRGITDAAGNSAAMGGAALFFRTLFGLAGNGDSSGSFITRMRAIRDTGTAGDEAGSAEDYLRGLFEEAGSTAEAARRGGYRRVQQDTAGSETVSLRHLFIFLRLLAGAYVRDYITGRFLRSKEELVIKSPVCREITLESTLH